MGWFQKIVSSRSHTHRDYHCNRVAYITLLIRCSNFVLVYRQSQTLLNTEIDMYKHSKHIDTNIHYHTYIQAHSDTDYIYIVFIHLIITNKYIYICILYRKYTKEEQSHKWHVFAYICFLMCVKNYLRPLFMCIV